MIQAGFDEGLVDTGILSLKDIKADYEAGGRPFYEEGGWLEEYRDRHADELDHAAAAGQHEALRIPRPVQLSLPRVDAIRALASPAPPSGPIRKAAAKIGRNDPCWCGSGKKYKKCHLGKDAPS